MRSARSTGSPGSESGRSSPRPCPSCATRPGPGSSGTTSTDLTPRPGYGRYGYGRYGYRVGWAGGLAGTLVQCSTWDQDGQLGRPDGFPNGPVGCHGSGPQPAAGGRWLSDAEGRGM